MEHQKAAGKSINKILNFLPRATSSVTFQNPPLYSPAKDKKPSEKTHKSNLGIGFSGPIFPTLPPESRRKTKNDSKFTPLHEPTSPRVSCMGQVKCKHYRRLTGAGTNKPTDKFSRTTSYAPVRTYNKEDDQEKVDPVVVKSKKKLGFWWLFGGSRRKSDATALTGQKGPCLGTMKRFSSGRDAFMNFDWTTQVAPLDSGHRNSFVDEEREEVAVPLSAPVTVRNEGICDGFVRVGAVKLEPRKEINLWKRRTMAQPQPLQVHALH